MERRSLCEEVEQSACLDLWKKKAEVLKRKKPVNLSIQRGHRCRRRGNKRLVQLLRIASSLFRGGYHHRLTDLLTCSKRKK